MTDIKRHRPKTLAGWIARLTAQPRDLAEEFTRAECERRQRLAKQHADQRFPSGPRVAISSAHPRVAITFPRRAS